MNTKFKTVLIVISVILSTVLPFKQVLSQGVAINENAADPHASAVLDVSSTEKGLLIPRMSTNERTSISNPAKGLMVFDNDLSQFWFFDGTSWTAIGGGDNIYTANDTLSDNRTVTHNNKNLTFVTGSGRAIIDGAFQTTGGVFAHVRTITSSPVWQDNDYIMICSFSGGGDLHLPNPSLFPGRVLLIRNNSIEGGGSGTINYKSYIPINNTSLTTSRGHVLVSDGTNWYVVAGV